jgi:biotin carboxylase
MTSLLTTNSRPALLVLAASVHQLPAIATAKRLGYRVITTDNMPKNPGHALADRAYAIDTTDGEAVLKIAQQESITGILAACTDVAVPTAAYVAEQLGLPGIPLACAKIVTDKLAFRHFLRQHHLPTPEYCAFAAGDSARSILQHLPNTMGVTKLPGWIVKPDRSSGSKGIFIGRSEAELADALPQTLAFSPGGRGICETVIEGVQGTCEGILRDGEIVWAMVLDRQTMSPPYTTTCGHRVPSRLPARVQQRLLEMLKRVWHWLGVTDAVFDCDFVVQISSSEAEGQIYLLELSPRLGGNSISTLVKTAIGFDLVAYAVQQACGVLSPLPPTCAPQPTAIVLFGAEMAGTLHYDAAAMAALHQEAWVASLHLRAMPGQVVSPFSNSRYCLGEACIWADSRDALDSAVQHLNQRLGWSVQ